MTNDNITLHYDNLYQFINQEVHPEGDLIGRINLNTQTFRKRRGDNYKTAIHVDLGKSFIKNESDKLYLNFEIKNNITLHYDNLYQTINQEVQPEGDLIGQNQFENLYISEAKR